MLERWHSPASAFAGGGTGALFGISFVTFAHAARFTANFAQKLTEQLINVCEKILLY